MRSALAAAAALAVVGGCRQHPPPTTPPATLVEWAQPSPDGRLEIRERREGTSCRVQAVVKSPDGDRSLWSTQTCLPSSRVVFLSPNGERLLVLDLIPSGRAAQSSDWAGIPLMSLWVRGAVIRQYTGAEILGQERASDMTKVLSWVQGEAYDDAKRAARPSADGEKVIIDLADGRTLTLGFDGGALPPPPVPKALPTKTAARAGDHPPPLEPVTAAGGAEGGDRAARRLAQDDEGLYSWVDEQGGLNFGHGSQVPARYRKSARLVDSTVGVVRMDVPTAAAAAPGQPAGAPGAALPASGSAPPPAPAPAAAAGAAAPAPGGAAQPAAPPAGGGTPPASAPPATAPPAGGT